MMRVNTDNNARAHQILARDDTVADDSGALLIPIENMEEISRITRILMEHGLNVYEVKELKLSLEEIYAHLHGG